MTPSSRPRDLDRAMHMVDAAKWIPAEASSLTLAGLLADRKTQLSLERQFEILGEAAAHTSEATQQQWPAIDWRRAKNFRNLIAHEYFRVDYAQILYTAQHVVPQLLPHLESLLHNLDQQFGPDAGV